MAISNIRTAYQNNASGTYSITHGLTIAANDVIIACFHVDLNANSITDNNGSYAFTEAYEAGTTDASTYAIYSRVAGASEPASYSWTVGSAAANSIILLVAAGVDTTSIWDVAPSATRGTGNSNSIVTNDMTVLTDGALGIVSGFVDSSNDAIFSSVNNSYGSGVTCYGNRDQALYRRESMSTGAAGATTISLSVTDNWAGHQYALKPAGAAPATSDRTCFLARGLAFA